ncbi:MAG: hypothetical protein R3E55_15560 [Burkholderiaceae bacterium]|jgi:hypothetical protein
MSKPQVRSAVKFDLFADAARKRKIEISTNYGRISGGCADLP